MRSARTAVAAAMLVFRVACWPLVRDIGCAEARRELDRRLFRLHGCSHR